MPSCFLIMLAGLIFWAPASLISTFGEPWDAPFYWTAIWPASIAIAAAAGFLSPRCRWLAGGLIQMGQVPFLVLRGSDDESGLILVGVGILLFQALVATAIAGAAAAGAGRVIGRSPVSKG